MGTERSRYRNLEGSITVEITLLMPLLIGVFLFLFFTSYYLHDAVAYEKGCAAALLRGSLCTAEGERCGLMEEALHEIRLLGKWEAFEETRSTDGRVEVCVKTEMPVREGLFLKLISGAYHLEIRRDTPLINETALIRKSRK